MNFNTNYTYFSWTVVYSEIDQNKITLNMEFPADKNKSKVYYCVFSCQSKAFRDEKVKFFIFHNQIKMLLTVCLRIPLKPALHKQFIPIIRPFYYNCIV